jgi:hypothetical protein
MGFAVSGMLLWYEDVIWFFGNFIVSRELEELFVKLKNVGFGLVLLELWWSKEFFLVEGKSGNTKDLYKYFSRIYLIIVPC